MTARNTAFFVSTIAIATACAPGLRVTGDVNGDELPRMVSAAYIPVELEDTDEVRVSVLLTSMPDACDFATDFTTAFADLTTATTLNDQERALDDYADVLKEYNAVGEWAVFLEATADREADFRDDANMDVDNNGQGSTSNLFFFDDEPNFDVENDVVDFNLDGYFAESGDVVWNLAAERQYVDFDAQLKLRKGARDSEGDRAGEVTISGRAQRCLSWEDVVTDD